MPGHISGASLLPPWKGWCDSRAAPLPRAFSFSPVIPAAVGIQSPDYAPTRSWQQIFGGWTAASHPALSLQHNLHYAPQGFWIPVATRMTGWGSRILTAARITAGNEKALLCSRPAIDCRLEDAIKLGPTALMELKSKAAHEQCPGESPCLNSWDPTEL